VLVLSALPVHAHSISAVEASAFRLVNHLPSVPLVVVWAPMQLGNFLIVPVAVLAALVVRRWRLAAELALAGAGVYLLAKQVKHFVLRGRPDSLLDDVLVRGAGVTVRLADGSMERGDVVIGADGLHSLVGSSLVKDEPPRYSGWWPGAASCHSTGCLRTVCAPASPGVVASCSGSLSWVAIRRTGGRARASASGRATRPPRRRRP
jgi:hypothetical protein